MGGKGSNLLVRVLTAAVLIVVVAGCVLLSPYSFLALLLVICAGGMWEFFRLAGAKGAQPVKWLAVAAGISAVVITFLVSAGMVSPVWYSLLILFVSALFIAELYRKKDNPLVNISVAAGGLAYVAVPMSLLCSLAFTGGGYYPALVLIIVAIVAVNDTFAYFTGVLFGKHRLFERISPKKSWEGFFGGLVFAVGGSLLYAHLTGGSLPGWGILGVLVVVAAVFGDLVESMFKRASDMKDSGKALPGHGGILDRIDALLIAIPIVYVYFAIFVN